MARVPKYIGWPLLAAWAYGVLYFFANRAVFFPAKFPEGLWELQSEVGASDIWLTSADGIRLHAWWIPQPGASFATLYLHGNAGNLTHRTFRAPEIALAGSSLLLLDYRGYGKSEGRPSETGIYADAEAGYQHLIERGFAPERIVVYGESLGTAAAIDLAARQPCAGLVLEAPFTSGRDVAARLLPVLGPLVMWRFDSKSKIGRVRAPILILHGNRDGVIPYDLGQALFEAAREPKQFWEVTGAGHNDIVQVAGPQYRERLRAFYQSLL
jgi:fermentation-respiration switch protein FrsA (DUF1100 family)